MELFDKIRALRLSQEMTQKELGQKLQVSEVSVRNWETGVKKPSIGAIIALSKLFDVSTDYILGVDYNTDFHPIYIDKQEKKLLNHYRQLDSHGKKVVDTICMLESSRIESQTKDIIELNASQRHIPLYYTPAAAGKSVPVENNDYELIVVDCNTPADADFAVKIQGNSMSPYIQDGEIVYIKKDCELTIGDVGIFCINGITYCKQYYIDKDNNLILVSLNPALRDTNIIINANDDSATIRCYGKVLLGYKIKIPEYILI